MAEIKFMVDKFLESSLGSYTICGLVFFVNNLACEDERGDWT